MAVLSVVLVATPAGAVSLRLGRSACVTAGVESALSRNASGPRATGSPMHLMTTAAPTVGRSALDGFDTATLAAGLLETAFVPGAGMVGVSLRHAGEELLDRQAGLRTYVTRGAVMG